jgi:hypothetical protein
MATISTLESTVASPQVTTVPVLGTQGDSTAQSMAFGIIGVVVGTVGIVLAMLQLRRMKRKIVFELA